MMFHGSTPERVDDASKSYCEGADTPHKKGAGEHPGTTGGLGYLIEYLCENSRGSLNSYKALLASLARLAEERGEDQDFTNLDIVAMARDEFHAWERVDISDSGSVAKPLSRALGSFKKSRNKIEEGFGEFLSAKKGIRHKYRIVVEKMSGGNGAGDRTWWRINLVSVEPGRGLETTGNDTAHAFSQDEQSAQSNVATLEYYSVAPGDGCLSKALDKVLRYPLVSWRKLLLVAFVIATGVALIFLMFLSLYSFLSLGSDVRVVLTASFVVIVLGFEIAPLYRVFFWRIVKAPSLFEIMDPFPGHRGDLFLVVSEDEKGVVKRELSAKKFSSVCPQCKGDVVAVSGGFEFPWRVVGRCLSSPAEHVYSFDICHLKGYRLR